MDELERGVEPLPGAVELVAELQERGVRTGVVSNSPLPFITRALELGGLDGFEAVVSGHDVPAPKPAPDAYLAACDQLGIAPAREVVAFEDSPTGVAAARAAGLTVIGDPLARRRGARRGPRGLRVAGRARRPDTARALTPLSARRRRRAPAGATPRPAR